MCVLGGGGERSNKASSFFSPCTKLRHFPIETLLSCAYIHTVGSPREVTRVNKT